MLDWVLIMPLVRLQILSQIERNRSKTEQQGRWTVKDEKSMFRKNEKFSKNEAANTSWYKKQKKVIFWGKKKKKKPWTKTGNVIKNYPAAIKAIIFLIPAQSHKQRISFFHLFLRKLLFFALSKSVQFQFLDSCFYRWQFNPFQPSIAFRRKTSQNKWLVPI